MTSSRNGYALFDLDFTLIPHDTLLLFCNYILKRARWRFAIMYIFFAPVVPLAALKLLGSHKLKRIFLSFLWGMRRERLEELAEGFAREIAIPLIYPEIRAELDKHREIGDFVILNTASPEFYVRHIAEHLRVDAFYGTPVELPEKMPLFPKFTRPNNKKFAKLIAMRGDMTPEVQSLIDHLSASAVVPADNSVVLKNSHAYSDSTADLPMLRIAEKGTMVHPTSSDMLAEGQQKGWTHATPPRPYSGSGGRIFAAIRQFLGVF